MQLSNNLQKAIRALGNNCKISMYNLRKVILFIFLVVKKYGSKVDKYQLTIDELDELESDVIYHQRI